MNRNIIAAAISACLFASLGANAQSEDTRKVSHQKKAAKAKPAAPLISPEDIIKAISSMNKEQKESLLIALGAASQPAAPVIPVQAPKANEMATKSDVQTVVNQTLEEKEAADKKAAEHLLSKEYALSVEDAQAQKLQHNSEHPEQVTDLDMYTRRRALAGNAGTKTLSENNVELLASSSGGQAKATLTIPLGTDTDKNNLGDLTFTFSAPTNQNSASTSPVTLASLDGMANASSIKVDWSRILPLITSPSPKKDDPKKGQAGAYFLVYGVSAQSGYNQFDYFNKQSLAKASSTDWSSAYSIYFGGGKTLGSAYNNQQLDLQNKYGGIIKYEYQNNYANQKTTTDCPVATSSPVACITGAIGTPQESRVNKWSLEGYWQSTHKVFGGPVLIEPTLAYDRVAKVTGLDVPIYFLQSPAATNAPSFGTQDVGATATQSPSTSKQPSTSVGVDFGWRSDTHGSIGIIVGTPVNLFGN